MTKYETPELNQKYRNLEMNHLSDAIKRFEKAANFLEKAKERYAEVVDNMNSRTWTYTKYDEYINAMLKEKNLKDFEISEYNNPDIFNKITELKDNYYNLFSISKNVVEEIKPKSLNDLAVVFAIGNIITHSDEKVFDIIKYNIKTENTENNFILFEEQIIKVIERLLKDKKQTEFLYKLLKSIKHSIGYFHKDKIIDKWDILSGFSVLDYLKENCADIYLSNVKIAHNTIEAKLKEESIPQKEIDKIFNYILLGCLVCCKQKQATDCAKKLYKLVEIESM